MPLHRTATLSVALAVATLLPLAVPASVAAQEDGEARTFTFSMGRPRIGVMLDVRADKDRDRLGARISSVTPDGPADRAGLKAGDIITRFNGEALGGAPSDDEEESGPAQKLMKLARKLEPGDTAAVEYRRDGDTKQTKIVARDLGGAEFARRFRVEMPKMPDTWLGREFPRMPLELENGPGALRIFVDGTPGGLQLRVQQRIRLARRFG